jgi:hypothetical protein
MGWLGLASGLVKLLSSFFKYLGDKQLLTAGEAMAAARSLEATLEVVTNAQNASDHVRRDPDSDYSKRLRDRFRRP